MWRRTKYSWGDHGTADRMSRELDFGCVWLNTHIPFVSEMPHGGFGASGYGKDLSGYGFEDYTRIKHVMSARYYHLPRWPSDYQTTVPIIRTIGWSRRTVT
jgi:hypothetical protein